MVTPMSSGDDSAVVVPRPRNLGPADRFTVGNRNTGGELSGGPKNGGVWVNCFLGTGVTVRVSAQEAEEFGLWLIECARANRQARPGR